METGTTNTADSIQALYKELYNEHRLHSSAVIHLATIDASVTTNYSNRSTVTAKTTPSSSTPVAYLWPYHTKPAKVSDLHRFDGAGRSQG